MEVAQARTASREVQVSAEAFSTPPPGTRGLNSMQTAKLPPIWSAF